MIRFAFVGFRHGHIFGLVRAVQEHAETEVVAACEEDGTTREVLAEDELIKITHDSFGSMLAEVDCDVVAVGDYYTKRGGLMIAALKAGKHVISDKPICTSVEE